VIECRLFFILSVSIYIHQAFKMFHRRAGFVLVAVGYSAQLLIICT